MGSPKATNDVLVLGLVLEVVVIGSRALSFSDPYIHFACLSVLRSVIRSVCPQLRS